MKKMSLQELKAMYPPPSPHYKSPDGLIEKTGPHPGSKKHCRHNHNPTYKPPKMPKGFSPAKWRRRRKTK